MLGFLHTSAQVGKSEPPGCCVDRTTKVCFNADNVHISNSSYIITITLALSFTLSFTFIT